MEFDRRRKQTPRPVSSLRREFGWRTNPLSNNSAAMGLRSSASDSAITHSKIFRSNEKAGAALVVEKIRASVQPVIDKNTDAIGAEFVRSFYAELKKFRAGR